MENKSIEEKLKSASESLNKAQAQNSERDVPMRDTSLDDRINEVREKMRKDSLLAEKNAADKLAERDYENFYRRKISKTASTAAAEKIEKRNEKELLLREEREREAKESAMREREEFNSRIGETDGLLSLIRNRKKSHSEKPETVPEPSREPKKAEPIRNAEENPPRDNMPKKSESYYSQKDFGIGINTVYDIPAPHDYTDDAPLYRDILEEQAPSSDSAPLSYTGADLFGLDVGLAAGLVAAISKTPEEEEFIPYPEEEVYPEISEHGLFEAQTDENVNQSIHFTPPPQHTVRVTGYRPVPLAGDYPDRTEHNISKSSLDGVSLYSDEDIDRISSEYKNDPLAHDGLFPDYTDSYDSYAKENDLAADGYDDILSASLFAAAAVKGRDTDKRDSESLSYIQSNEYETDELDAYMGIDSEISHEFTAAEAYFPDGEPQYDEASLFQRELYRDSELYPDAKHTEESAAYTSDYPIYDTHYFDREYNGASYQTDGGISALTEARAYESGHEFSADEFFAESVSDALPEEASFPKAYTDSELYGGYSDILYGEAAAATADFANHSGEDLRFQEDYRDILTDEALGNAELGEEYYATKFVDFGAPNGNGGHYRADLRSDSDSRALSEYETALGMKMPEPKKYDIKEEDYAADFGEASLYSLDAEEAAPVAEHADYSDFTERSLRGFVKESEKRVSEYKREVKKLSKRQSRLSTAEALELTVDKLNINRAIVEERAESLSAACAVGSGSCKRRFKKLLSESIAEYNVAVGEYEAETGYTLSYASRSIPSDIIAGRAYRRLPVVNYIMEDEFDGTESALHGMSRSERKQFRKEQLRVAKESEREEARLRKMSSGKRVRGGKSGTELSDVQKKIDRNTRMLEARFDSEKTELEKARDFAEYSFSASYKNKKDTVRELDAAMRSLGKKRAEAIRLDRDDSERYYAALLIRPETVALKKRGKLDRLESLNMRLDALLSERERINEQLIKLYTGGSEGRKSDRQNAKSVKVRRKTARKVKRRFRRDMKILNDRIPLDLKEKLVKCANKIIAAEAENGDLRYKIKKQRPNFSVKRDMKRRIKENRASIKRYLSDYRHFLKKCRRYAERRKDFKIQLLWIFFVLLLIGAGIAVYFIFGDKIAAFFSK